MSAILWNAAILVCMCHKVYQQLLFRGYEQNRSYRIPQRDSYSSTFTHDGLTLLISRFSDFRISHSEFLIFFLKKLFDMFMSMSWFVSTEAEFLAPLSVCRIKFFE